MKRLICWCMGGMFLGVLNFAFVLVILVGCGQKTSPSDPPAEKTKGDASCCADATHPNKVVLKQSEVLSCDGTKAVAIFEEVTGQDRADALMDQWKRNHPDRDWVELEKRSHALPEPADNSAILEGGQAKGHAYGDFTEIDLLIWARETQKFVAEGSRIFHSGDALGSTVGVSCDMCHPHAANTHPETYPKFQTQLGRVVLLRDMINWCIENPVRGKKLAADSPEMRALEAYIMAQRKGVEMNYGKH
jgi:thiosulfate dehydrogenase